MALVKPSATRGGGSGAVCHLGEVFDDHDVSLLPCAAAQALAHPVSGRPADAPKVLVDVARLERED